jgi:hypothetical protein
LNTAVPALAGHAAISYRNKSALGARSGPGRKVEESGKHEDTLDLSTKSPLKRLVSTSAIDSDVPAKPPVRVIEILNGPRVSGFHSARTTIGSLMSSARLVASIVFCMRHRSAASARF